MPKFEKNPHEYINTIPLAWLFVGGVTVSTGCLLVAKWEGVVFGVVAMLVAPITGGVLNLVFNKVMKNANYLCFTLGTGCVSLFFYNESFLVFYILIQVSWVIYLFSKFHEID